LGSAAIDPQRFFSKEAALRRSRSRPLPARKPPFSDKGGT
jgi:hypothetical protein